MVSRLLLLLTFLAVALIGDGVVRGAPAEYKEDDCTLNAYGIYDLFTKGGCSKKASAEVCQRIFFNAVIALNAALAVCQPPDGYTLCRLKNPGAFSTDGCISTFQYSAIPKEKCEEERKKDFIAQHNDGSQETYSSSEAYCVETPNFDCHKLC